MCFHVCVSTCVCVCVSSKKKILPHPRLVSYVKETVFISVLDDLTVTLEKKLHISQVIFFFFNGFIFQYIFSFFKFISRGLLGHFQ